MAYKTLTTPTMVTITGAWLDEEHEKPLIAALPQAGPLLAGAEKAHKGLVLTQKAGGKVNEKAVALQKQQEILDVLHDRKSRGIYNALTAFADLADDADAAAAILGVRDRLYPQGLRLVQWSYTDEAGDAELVDKRLTKTDKALLKQLPAPGGTLADEHKAQVKAAKKLGELEKEKIALLATAPSTTGIDVVRARNLWIRTVTAFVAVLALEDLSDADRARILGPLEEAERKADRRAPKGEATEPTPKKGADAPAAPADPTAKGTG
jgi:hypothetical protein